MKAYSQQTWALLTGGAGRELVARFLPSVVDYYVAQSKASNYAVSKAQRSKQRAESKAESRAESGAAICRFASQRHSVVKGQGSNFH